MGQYGGTVAGPGGPGRGEKGGSGAPLRSQRCARCSAQPNEQKTYESNVFVSDHCQVGGQEGSLVSNMLIFEN